MCSLLHQVGRPHSFLQLTSLVLAHNSLTSLASGHLHLLPCLQRLDVRHNRLRSLQETLSVLSHCGSLRVLFLQVTSVHRISTEERDAPPKPD